MPDEMAYLVILNLGLITEEEKQTAMQLAKDIGKKLVRDCIYPEKKTKDTEFSGKISKVPT